MKAKSQSKVLRSKVVRVSEDYQKRKFTNDTVSHFILYPVVFSAVGRKNEFYIHALSLCWNDKNILKDSRCQQLLRGLNLKQPIETESLSKSADGWFKSCRHNDLEKIGKVAGHFIRLFSRTVGIAIDKTFDPQSAPINDETFTDFVSNLKHEKTIVPAIIKLQLSAESAFDTSKFIRLTEKNVNDLSNGDEVMFTTRCKILKIASEFHDWAWHLLNMVNCEDRQKILSGDFPPIAPLLQEINTPISQSDQASARSLEYEMEEDAPVSQISYRSSTRLKRPNKMYSQQLYVLK